MNIIIVECVHNKYYVDCVEKKNMKKRLLSLRDGKRNSFVRMFPAKKLIMKFTSKYKNHVNHVTVRWMRNKGIRNVRGGVFSNVKLNKSQKKYLRKRLQWGNNTCFRCGRTDHISFKCKEKTYVNGDPITDTESSDDDSNDYNDSNSNNYSYSTKIVDNRPTPGMTWHSIPP